MLAIILTIVFSAIAAIATVYLAGLEIKKRKKADLSIIVLSYDAGVQAITIKNDGEADAKNISISFPESFGFENIDKDILSTLIYYQKDNNIASIFIKHIAMLIALFFQFITIARSNSPFNGMIKLVITKKNNSSNYSDFEITNR